MAKIKRTLEELVDSIEREAATTKPHGYRQKVYHAFGQYWLVTYMASGRPKKLEHVDADGNPIRL